MLLVYVECFILVIFQYMACGWFSECDSNNNECCPNYYRVNGVCTECPAGTFGVNCSGTCPTNYYGQFCKNECNCPNYQYCNLVHGCENISNDGENLKCVQNYLYLNGNCTECPKGRFGVNCTKSCPDNYFGLFCRELCNCSADQYCDQVKGCQTNNNECLNGTFGLNCSNTCPTNYFGHLCQTVCNCSTDQYCDMVTGCLQNERYPEENHTSTSKRTTVHLYYTKELTTVTIFEDTYVWENMTYALSGSIVTALLVAAITCLRSRLKKNRKHQSFRCPGENQADPSGKYKITKNNELKRTDYSINTMSFLDAGQSNGELNIENIDYVQENARGEASGNMNNIYDDLRTSKMLDSFHVDDTKEISFSTCSNESDNPNGVHSDLSSRFFTESQLMYTNSDEDANRGDTSIPNYEQFQMPFQYSILSLKRNINPPAAELYGQTEYSNGDAYDFVNVYENSGSSCSSDSQSESNADSTFVKTKNEIAER